MGRYNRLALRPYSFRVKYGQPGLEIANGGNVMSQPVTTMHAATPIAQPRALTLAMSVGGEAGLHDLPRLCKYGLGVEITDFIAVSTWQGDYQAHARRWAEALRDFPGGKCLHGAFIDLHPSAVEPEVVAFARRRHQQSLEVAATLGCDLMVVHSDFPTREALPVRQTERAARLVEYFGDLAHAATAYGVTLAVENIYDTNPRQLADLADAINLPNLGLSLDVGHANLYGPTYALDEWLAVLRPHLRHVHLHDNDGRYDRHWAVGSGSMSFRAFHEAVRDMAPAPRVTIEVVPREDAWRTFDALREQGW